LFLTTGKSLNLIAANSDLVSESDYETFLVFKSHALAFEEHQYDRLDSYPLFPAAFEGRFHP